MLNMSLPAAIVLGGLISIALFSAQNTSVHREPSLPNFPKLFPRPTGHNGYEDFVMASDLFNASPACQDYENENDIDAPRTAALGTERKVLADPMGQRVLAAMRAGLRKRVRSPREAPELHTQVPELKTFRAIGRLLCAEMEVRFADGQTSRAIDCLNDGLNFGRAVKISLPIGGVTGLYIENITLHAFSLHLKQLALPDCVKLIHVASDQLKRPDPQVFLVPAERDMFLRSLQKYRTDAVALLDQMDPGPNASASAHDDYTNVCRAVRSNPNSDAALFDQAAALVSEHYDQSLAEIKRPVWERQYPMPSERDSLAAKLVYAFVPPSYSRMGDRFASERVMLQILALHAAVLHYRQQSGHLPGSVEELKLGSLAVDPFTGTPLVYRRIGDQAYEICSVGAFDPGSSKHPPTGLRIPIVVSYPSEGIGN